MANGNKNIIITPNIGSTTADPKIQFLGGNTSVNTDMSMYVYPSSNGTLSFEGSAGQLFSITNDLTGSIFSVNDVSGIPSIEVFANGQISLAPYGGNVVFGSTSAITAPIFYDSANTSFYLDPAASGANTALKLAGKFEVGPFNYATTNSGEAWIGRGSDRLAGTLTVQLGTGTGRKFEVVDYNWSAVEFSVDDSGVATAAGSFRAPIFYDSDNTAYYMDLNSTSRLNVLQFASGATNGPYFNYGNNQQNLYLRGSSGADIGVSLFDVNNTWRGQLYASAVGYGFLASNWGLWDLQKVSTGKLYLNNQTTYYIDTNEIYYNRVYGVTDIRSPIFYDNNDTAYYIDPASTADVALRMRGGAYFGPNTSWSEYLYVGGNGRVGTSATVAVTNGNLHLDSKNGNATYLNWYSQGNVYTGTSANLGVGSDSATQRLHVHGTGLATTDFRAPIFYDSDNTAYYTNPNSTSNINALTVVGKLTALSGTNEMSGHHYWTAYNAAGNHYPHFNDGTDASGTKINWRLYLGATNSVTHTWTTAAATFVTSLVSSIDARAPIFYDQNNTAYYTDPASTSVLNVLTAANINATNLNASTIGWNSIVPVFGQRGMYLNELVDILYQADKRFTVTNGSSIYFDGNFDSSVVIPVNTTRVININIAGQAGIPANGITYCGGVILVSFYYTSNLYSSLSLRVKNYLGTWTNAAAPTNISTNASYKVMAFTVPIGNYLTDIELTVVTGATNEAWLASINYYGDRWTTELELPYVSKYLTSNYMFGNFGVKNDTGGINNLLSGTASSYLSAIGGSVGIGNASPSYKLHVTGTAYASLDFRAPIFYDFDNTAYYLDPLSTSNLNTVQAVDAFRSDRFEDLAGNFFFREGVLSGVTRHLNLSDSNSDPASVSSDVGISWGARSDNNPYYMIWTSNYNNAISTHSRLRLGWHTGIEIGSATTYGGTRFFNNSPGIAGAEELMSIGKLDAHVRVVNNLHSKIYYDIDNTTYYADLASTPSIVIAPYAVTGGISSIGASPIEMPLQNAASTNTWYPLTRQRAAYSEGYYTHVVTGLYKQASAGSGWASGTSGWFVAVGGNDNYPTEEWRLTYGGYLTNSLGYVAIGGSARSPIFYDVNNTAYYTDPASTSVLNALTVGGSSVVTYGDATLMYRRGTITTEDWNTFIDGSESGYWQVNNGSGLNKPSAYMYGTMVAWSSVGAAKLQLYAPHNGSESAGIFIRTGWDTDYDAWSEIAVSGKSFTNSVDLRAPIFYDSNNTGYYVDPAGATNLFNLYIQGGVANPIASAQYYDAAIEVREFAFGGAQTDSWSYAPRIGFHWAGRTAAQIGMGSNARISMLNADASGFAQLQSSNFYSPIFYDIDNTAYYVDPATGTNLNGTFINNGGTAMNGGWNRNLLLQSQFPVVVFNSNNTKYSGIGVDYSDAASGFRFWVNGTSTDISGTGTIALSINTGNFVTAASSFRAPIFYDSNDTTYFIDPAGDTSIYVAGEINCSGYAVGAMQPGALSIGSISRDYSWEGSTWASDIRLGILANCSETWEFAVHDSGDSIMSMFRYNGTDQILMGRDIGWGTCYVQAAASFRAPIFYDSNNTAYYVDAASTSSLNGLTVAAQITGSIQYVTGGIAPNTDNYMNFRVMRNNNSSSTDGMYIGYGNAGGAAAMTRIFGGGATNGEMTKYADRTEEPGSFRAPIFYDVNNTAYYTDPASTSVLNALTVGGVSITPSRMIAMSILFG